MERGHEGLCLDRGFLEVLQAGEIIRQAQYAGVPLGGELQVVDRQGDLQGLVKFSGLRPAIGTGEGRMAESGFLCYVEDVRTY